MVRIDRLELALCLCHVDFMILWLESLLALSWSVLPLVGDLRLYQGKDGS